MSKIAFSPNDSGTGTFTIESPPSNSNRSLSFPDENGTLATVENLPPGYTDQDALDLFNAGGSAPVFACRAWVNFDGTTTPPDIRGSGNVSSVTRESQGQFTVNFTTAMQDTNYCVAGTTTTDDNAPERVHAISVRTGTINTTSVGVNSNRGNGGGGGYNENLDIFAQITR